MNIPELVRQIETLETEKQDIQTNIKEIYQAAKKEGVDTKALRRVITLRKQDPQDIEEQETLVALYLNELESTDAYS